MTKLGIDADGVANADHAMKCPACDQWFDLLDLGQIIEHVHDGEIEVLDGPGERRSGKRIDSPCTQPWASNADRAHTGEGDHAVRRMETT
jgi:hypothetical protein